MPVLSPTCVELPEFTTPPITKMGGDEIARIVAPILSKRLSETKYDRVVLAVQYLEHLRSLRAVNPSITAIEAYATYKINSSLAKNNGNSCVGLSLDLMRLLQQGIVAYPAGAILSNRYQQKCGPRYSHVTPMIAYQKSPKDKGLVILDPSFHIGKPIVLPANGPAYTYDMGGKKGVWRFSIDQERVLCQAGARDGEPAWDLARSADSLMIYRTDQITNPEESSALPMFAIDRSYPIVSRFPDGSQIAHINVDLNKREVHIKIGEEKHPSAPFPAIRNGTFRFSSQLAKALLLDTEDLNESVSLIVEEADSLDELYRQFIELLRKDDLLRSNLRDPETA